MHILVTNDDGVFAPGLLALAQAVRPFGKVSVLAPDRNWSASGHVKTLHRPLRVKEVQLADGSPALASDGAPSDCVALAVLGILPEPIDLVVSGINPNANVGHDVTYSGTDTAAMEAQSGGCLRWLSRWIATRKTITPCITKPPQRWLPGCCRWSLKTACRRMCC